MIKRNRLASSLLFWGCLLITFVNPTHAVEERLEQKELKIDLNDFSGFIRFFRAPLLPEIKIWMEEDLWHKFNQEPTHEFYQINRSIGSNATVEDYKKLFIELERHADKGSLSALVGAHRKLVAWNRWSSKTRVESLRWLDTQITDSNKFSVAQEAKLFAQIELAQREIHKSEVSEEEAMQALWTYYDRILDADTFSLFWRLLSIEKLLEYEMNAPPPMIYKGMTLVTQMLSDGHIINANNYDTLLTCFTRLDRTPTWNQTAKALTTAYHTMQHPIPIPSKSDRDTSWKAPHHNALYAIFDMLISVNDNENAEKMVYHSYPEFASDLNIWTVLVERNSKTLLHKLIQTHGQGQLSKRTRPFTPAYEENIAECLEGLPTDIAFYAEVCLAGLTHERNGKRSHSALNIEAIGIRQPHSSRYVRERRRSTPYQRPHADPMFSLAQRFNDIDFQNPELRRLCLSSFCNVYEEHLSRYLEDALAKEVNDLAIETVLTQERGTKRDIEFKLLLGYYQARLLNGDPNAYVQALQTSKPIMQGINTDRRAPNYDLECTKDYQLYNFPVELGPLIQTSWTPTQMRALARASRALLLYTPKRFQPRLGKLDTLLAFNVLALEMDQLESIQSEIPEAFRSTLKDYQSPHNFHDFKSLLRQYLSDNRQLSITHKLNICFSLDQTQPAPENLTVADCLDIAKQHLLFNAGEIFSKGHELVELVEDKSKAWEDLATLHQQNYGVSQAAEFWLESIKTSENKYNRMNRQLAYIQCLRGSNKPHDALAYIKTIDTEEWPDRLLSELNKEKQQLAPYQTRIDEKTSNGGYRLRD